MNLLLIKQFLNADIKFSIINTINNNIINNNINIRNNGKYNTECGIYNNIKYIYKGYRIMRIRNRQRIHLVDPSP